MAVSRHSLPLSLSPLSVLDSTFRSPFYLIPPFPFHHPAPPPLFLYSLLPSLHDFLPPSILPPISFTRAGLQLISVAGCICFHSSGPFLQMCINRPSGVVIANKDPVCVQKRTSCCHKRLYGSQLPQIAHREGIYQRVQAQEEASVLG